MGPAIPAIPIGVGDGNSWARQRVYLYEMSNDDDQKELAASRAVIARMAAWANELEESGNQHMANEIREKIAPGPAAEPSLVLPLTPGVARAIDAYLDKEWSSSEVDRMGALSAASYIGERVAALYRAARLARKARAAKGSAT